MPFWKRDKGKKEEKSAGNNRSFQDFLKASHLEMEGLMVQDPQWYHHLPYRGAMSLEKAKSLEIEKRAVWRRVIYDARRTQLTGLRWETRCDDLVCPDCQKMENRIFSFGEYDLLNETVMHVGCRCILVSVRE
jgi:hypothetical protein